MTQELKGKTSEETIKILQNVMKYAKKEEKAKEIEEVEQILDQQF